MRHRDLNKVNPQYDPHGTYLKQLVLTRISIPPTFIERAVELLRNEQPLPNEPVGINGTLLAPEESLNPTSTLGLGLYARLEFFPTRTLFMGNVRSDEISFRDPELFHNFERLSPASLHQYKERSSTRLQCLGRTALPSYLTHHGLATTYTNSILNVEVNQFYPPGNSYQQGEVVIDYTYVL